MKFDYKNVTEETVQPKAYLYKFNGSENEFCLAVVTEDERVVWFYEDGEVLVQSKGTLMMMDLIKTFYEGDSITITF